MWHAAYGRRKIITRIIGDDLNEHSSGYACFKGVQNGPAHRDPHRLLHPLKRQPDGSYTRIPLQQALDEIAERIGGIVADPARGPLHCLPEPAR